MIPPIYYSFYRFTDRMVDCSGNYTLIILKFIANMFIKNDVY